MTATVIWLVIWGVLVFASMPLLVMLGTVTGAMVSSSEWAPVAGIITGYVLGAALAVFSLVQAILQLITLVQMLV